MKTLTNDKIRQFIYSVKRSELYWYYRQYVTDITAALIHHGQDVAMVKHGLITIYCADKAIINAT